ncbi:nucleotidyltransferase family protein [Streptomyces antioxidans]|uniref:nucleotidyltransferase family protein n=1 Tax=Streptomyces antioxidans TaxID=1507734 RepID=UPI001301DDD4|nr:nucleotidyltransferase family protein [Streptomyces antioxidans]
MSAAMLADQIQRGIAKPAAEQARAHKVVPQVATWLDPAESAGDLSYYETSAKVLASSAVEVSTALGDAGVDAVLLRGFALQRWYPDERRQFSDLDIGVRHLGDLAKVLTALKTAGYHVTRPVIARRSATGWWAAAALQKPTDEMPHPIYLDITVPGPGITPFRHYPMLESDWEQRESYAVSGAPIPVPSATSLLSIFAVEMHERRTVIARDLLDLSHLLTAGPDVTAAARRLAGQPVRRGLTRLAEAVAESQEHGHLMPAIAELLTGLPHGSRIPRRAGRVAGVPASHTDCVSPSQVRRALRHGAPVYCFPDPCDRLPGLRGSALHRGLSGLVARSQPVALEYEITYSIPPRA